MAPRGTNTTPMGGVDIGELFKPFASMAPDWSKMMQGFSAQGFPGQGLGGQGFAAGGKVWQDLLQSHQRNIESVTRLNSGVADAMRQIAERQVELMQATMREMASISSSMQAGQGKAMPSTDTMSAAFDRTLSAMREIAEIAEKANREALSAITERSQEFQGELKAMLEGAGRK
jgi:phasin family protein